MTPTTGAEKAPTIVVHRGLRVALRVDGDEDEAEFFRIAAEFVRPARHVGERGRTDVGTVGEAEERHRWLAAEDRLGHRGPVVVDELERAAERRARRKRGGLRALPEGNADDNERAECEERERDDDP